MQDTEYARQTYTKAARNLIRQANLNLSVGNTDEGRALVKLAGEQLDRALSPTCEIYHFPKVREMEPA